MQISRKNNTFATIAMVLLLTMTISLVACPITNGQTTTGRMMTYSFIGAVPNPIAVKERTLIHYGITEGLGAVDQGYEGLTVTVTDPQGDTETFGPLKTDSTGGSFIFYTPTQIGTYYLQTHFPEQVLKYESTRTQPPGTVMEASSSEKLALIVQEDPLELYPGVPLPTEYWTRPIDAQAREWSSIAGNWLITPPHRFTDYNDYAPESAHILWTKPIATGGLVGGLYGEAGPVSMETGDAYEGFFTGAVRNSGGGPVIINGKLYYNDYSQRSLNTGVEQNVVCVDLHTGEELWVRNWNNSKLEFGQLFYWQSYNYQGTYGYLWAVNGSTWDAYDPLTGRWIYSMTNVPSGTRLYGSKGEIYIYYVDLAKGWMMLWNSSRVVSDMGSFSRALTGQTFNVSMFDYETRPRNSGYEWNKTIPTGLPFFDRSRMDFFFEDRMIVVDLTSSVTSYSYNDNVNVYGINLKPGQEGQLLFSTSWPKPPEMAGNQSISWVDSSIEDKLGILRSKELRQHYGVSLDTGELIWGPTDSTPYLDFYEGTILTSHFIAYGNVYTAGLSGVVYCYDAETGAELWTYTAEDPYRETEIGNNWWLGIVFFADGKVYLGHGEHSPNMPMPRGAPFVCLNATTGEEIWRIDGAFRQTGWGGLGIIGDSIIATMDTYDQRIYAIGKGPSKTTVTAPDMGVPLGSSVVIRGMVTDESPGTKEYSLTARFPSGVPAIADESMSDWMLYVYKQFPRPANAKGVEVILETLDPNNNYYEIGRATSDASGLYSIMWEPPVPGKYTIIARFEGSESYFSSYAENALGVTEAPSPAVPIEPEPTEPTEAFVITTEIAIIAAVVVAVVIGIVAFWALRKRK